MTINEHIIQLLYSYDCVIIPNFGGFVARYFPAEIQEGTYMFRPPSKRISFNARLKENDGLVAHYISQKEGISYQEAVQMIEISVRAWYRILESGNKITLEGIGKIYSDSEGNLQFTPSLEANFLTSSYGFGLFRSPAITEESMITQSIRKQAEIEGKIVEHRNIAYFMNNLLQTVKVASIILVVGSVFYLAIDNSKIFTKSQNDSFSYIGFTAIQDSAVDFQAVSPETDNLGSEPYESMHEQPETPSAKNDIPKQEETSQANTVTKTEEIKSPEVLPTAKSTSAQPVASVDMVEISTGAFGIEANAQRRAQELMQHSIPSDIIKSGKLYRVVVRSERKDADALLMQIKETVAPDAFVLN